MHNTVAIVPEMTMREVRASAAVGTTIATTLRDKDAEQRFRYPHAIFLFAMKYGYGRAANKALELANGQFTMDDAMKYVRKVFAEGKAAIKEREAYRAG